MSGLESESSDLSPQLKEVKVMLPEFKDEVQYIFREFEERFQKPGFSARIQTVLDELNFRTVAETLLDTSNNPYQQQLSIKQRVPFIVAAHLSQKMAPHLHGERDVEDRDRFDDLVHRIKNLSLRF